MCSTEDFVSMQFFSIAKKNGDPLQVQWFYFAVKYGAFLDINLIDSHVHLSIWWVGHQSTSRQHYKCNGIWWVGQITSRQPCSMSTFLNFWYKLATCTGNKLSCILYRLMFAMHNNNSLEGKWIISVENNLNELGLLNVWLYQGQGANLNWLKNTIKQRLLDQS